jgi:hypothetical protein
MPKVGIFFFIDNSILVDAVPVEKGEQYGNAIQHGSHFEFWESLVPKTLTERQFKARAYDAYPRGRVVYFPNEKKCCIYADTCLERKNIVLVGKQFELIDEDIELQTDEHYKCAGCNPYFLD